MYTSEKIVFCFLTNSSKYVVSYAGIVMIHCTNFKFGDQHFLINFVKL